MHRKNGSWLYRNSLSVVFLFFFFLALAAQLLSGWKSYNEEREEQSALPLSLGSYMESGHFIAATFENFQSEFLQMAVYVILTISLRQIGSAESKKINGKEAVDREPVPRADAPWPVKKGGWRLKMYSHSLSIAFALLFFASWALHLYGSFKKYNVHQELIHKAPLRLTAFLREPDFWFETFQNWQSEFLSVASIVILTIFLRQKGSPQSKPVDASTWETGK